MGNSGEKSGWKTLAGLLAGALLFAALGMVSIHIPFGRDQGVAAYAAEVMARGGTLYRDFFHFNLPGIFFVYRIARLLPLPVVEAVNLTHLVFTLLTYFAVFGAARRALPARLALAAAWFYAAFAIVLYTTYWNIAQKDSLAALPLALALWAALAFDQGRERSGRGRLAGRDLALLAAFGIFAGLAAQFKPTLGIVLLLALGLAPAERRTPPTAVAVVLVPGLGFIISFLPLLAYLLAAGAFAPMLESVFRFGGFYGGQNFHGAGRTLLKTLWEISRWLYDWRFLAALAVIGSVAGRRERPLRLAALFLGLLLMQVVVQMKFFTYHWVPLLVPAAVLAAEGAGVLLRPSESGPRRWMTALVLLALLAGTLGADARRYQREVLYDLGRVYPESFLAPYGKWGGGDLSPLASAAVASYVRARTAAADPIIVFGLEPGLYVSAGRFPATRFAYDQPLVTDPRGDPRFTAYREGLRAEFLKDLAARPPVYFIVIENDATGVEKEDSYTQMRAWKELSDLIDREYVLETRIEDYYLYRRLGREGS